MDTRTLALRASSGDRVAIAALLERNLGRLRAFIRARCGPMLRAKESCSDLVQTVCREVLEDMGDFRYEDEARFRHWLFKRAEHKLIDRVRYWEAGMRAPGREAPPGSGLDDDPDQDFVTFLTPSREAISREKVKRIQAALDQLPPDYRDAILLHRLVELPYEEIASEMGRSEGAVRNLVYRGLARLSLLLQDDATQSGGS